jgi:hypothetical protein
MSTKIIYLFEAFLLSKYILSCTLITIVEAQKDFHVKRLTELGLLVTTTTTTTQRTTTSTATTFKSTLRSITTLKSTTTHAPIKIITTDKARLQIQTPPPPPDIVRRLNFIFNCLFVCYFLLYKFNDSILPFLFILYINSTKAVLKNLNRLMNLMKIIVVAIVMKFHKIHLKENLAIMMM